MKFSPFILIVPFIINACNSPTGELGVQKNEILSYSYFCEPEGMDSESLNASKLEKFENISDVDSFALSLVDCLNDTRSDIRDGIAYEALTYFLRQQKLSPEALSSLKERLLAINTGNDAANVGRPFSALVLSEVARADRIEPLMSKAERSEFVEAAVTYVQGITDYRGFTDNEGWRHGVAHGADWLMQLSLNRQLSDSDLLAILNSVKSQIRADRKHAYIHGEPNRLARPVLFIAQRGVFSEKEWTDWLSDFANPSPMENWGEAFKSESGLAHRHNVKSFLYALYVSANHSKDEKIRILLPGLSEQIKQVP